MENIKIITPTDNIEDLERQWGEWNQMTYKERKISNEESLAKFGVTNLEIYENIKNEINSSILESDTGDIVVVHPDKDGDTEYYRRLLNNKYEEANGWSTENNIVLIGSNYDAVDTLDNLEREFDKFNQMTPHQKRLSQDMSLRLYGMDNIVHYNIIKSRLTSEEYVDDADNLSPYYLPSDMIELGVFSENAEDNFYNVVTNHESVEWFNEYAYTMDSGEDYYERVLGIYREFVENPTDLNKQRLLEVGWNPEVEFNYDILKMVSELAIDRLQFSEVEIVDLTGNNIDTFINESSKARGLEIIDKHIKGEPLSTVQKIHPIYLVHIYSNSPFAKAVRLTMKDTYNHVALGLDSALDKLFSFNMGTRKKPGGMSTESIKDYLSYNNETDMSVHVMFLKDKDFNKLKDNINSFLSNSKNSSYNYKNLFNIIINKASKVKDQFSMVCSQFVDTILKAINIDITNKPSNLVRPEDLYKVNSPKIYKIYEGKAKRYNNKEANSIIYKLLRTDALPMLENGIDIGDIYIPMLVMEAKEFPVGFEDDGSLIIRNYKSLNLELEYEKANKLLRSYKRNKNSYPMAYELCKLWFFNTVLLKKIESADKRKRYEEKEKLVKLRAKVMNAFTIYLNELNTLNKDFNFSEYYDNTPFSDTSIRISGSTIKYTKDYLLKLFV